MHYQRKWYSLAHQMARRSGPEIRPLRLIHRFDQRGFAHLNTVVDNHVQYGRYPTIVIAFDTLALVKEAPGIVGFVDQFAW